MSGSCDRCGDAPGWECLTVEVADDVWASLCPACRAEVAPSDEEFIVRIEWTVSKENLAESYHDSVEQAFRELFWCSGLPGETWRLLLEDGEEAYRLPEDEDGSRTGTDGE